MITLSTKKDIEDFTIIQKTINRHMTERIGKGIATASFGLIGQATLLCQANAVRPGAILYDSAIAE